MLLKRLFVVLFVLGLAINVSAADKKDVKWETKIEDAVKIAKKENKAILVNFTGSDWCIWCKKLQGEVFSQAEFAKYANDNLVLVKLDFPRNVKQSKAVQEYNRGLMKKYGVRGFPTILLLDKNGEYLKTTGYQQGGAKNYVTHLKGLLK